jgi:hypothetical protein
LKSLFDDINPYISKLKQDKKLYLEGELTPQETLSALKLMKNDKSPGMDGFTTEFYKFFWKDINLYKDFKCSSVKMVPLLSYRV